MAMNWQFKASCETQRASWVAYKEALTNSLDRGWRKQEDQTQAFTEQLNIEES